MLFCINCNTNIETPLTYTEENGEEWHVCPICCEAGLHVAKSCALCGKWIDSEVNDLCDVCQGESLRQLYNILVANFNETQIEFFRDAGEGLLAG